MFTEAESTEELAQIAVDELKDLDTKLGTESADADWDSYLGSFVSKSVLEPSSTMLEEQGKTFEGVRFAGGEETPVVVYVYFDGKSKSLSVVSSYEYENYSTTITNLENVELRFVTLTSSGITS